MLERMEVADGRETVYDSEQVNAHEGFYPLGRRFTNPASARQPDSKGYHWRLLAWSRGPLGRPMMHGACNPSGAKSVACGGRTRARNPRLLSERMRLRNVAFGAAGLAVPCLSSNRMSKNRYDTESKRAKRALKKQNKKSARRARFGPSMKAAPVVVRSLETGEIIPEKKAHEPKRTSSTYSRHLNRLARKAGYADYGDYLLSPAWKRLRLEVLTRDKWTCVGCGSKMVLQVHHDRYGGDLHKVPADWLRTLCQHCHKRTHGR